MVANSGSGVESAVVDGVLATPRYGLELKDGVDADEWGVLEDGDDDFAWRTEDDPLDVDPSCLRRRML